MHDPKKVLEICAAATRGPWVTNVKHYEHCIVSKPLYDEGINYLISGRCCLSQDDDFVVLARTALPEFAQRVIDLEQQRREDMELMEETLGAQKMALATIEKYKSENTKLRAVAEAAMKVVRVKFCQISDEHSENIMELEQALTAARKLIKDKEKERLTQEAIDYLEPLIEHPTLTGRFCKYLKFAVEALKETVGESNDE